MQPSINKATVSIVSEGLSDLKMGDELKNVSRCPHCNIAHPRLTNQWSQTLYVVETANEPRHCWGSFICASCECIITVRSTLGETDFIIDQMFPDIKQVSPLLPERAQNYLRQAMDCLGSPDAAVITASGSIEAMLKDKGYLEGNLFERINQALKDNIITKGMADWAHTVRLDANNSRHVDDTKPHATAEEARRAVDFAEALGVYLYELPARIAQSMKEDASI